MTTVKERPILFKGDMVRAILEGRKAQTRRVVRPQPAYPSSFDGLRNELNGSTMEIYLPGATKPAHFWHCPYGQPGDRLWVREAHSIHMAHGQHRHDGKRWGPWGGLENTVSPDGTKIAYYREGFDRCAPRWRPSIHMPRWASRILLEVVSVRVDRLRNINEDDAKREGAVIGQFYPGAAFEPMNYRDAFSQLWESLAAPGEAWADNPWVWAVEFKRVEVQS